MYLDGKEIYNRIVADDRIPEILFRLGFDTVVTLWVVVNLHRGRCHLPSWSDVDTLCSVLGE
jgi:hypothetical protein